jgi:hypothetical protein
VTTGVHARLQAALAERYAVKQELGRGGMATVYLAHDLKHDRPVALKVMHPELAPVLGLERFLREIRFAALGREREALDALDREFPSGAAIFPRNMWALERARLAEKLRQIDKARQWYGFVARLWRNGDPELQRVVAEAREALTRLTGEQQ